MDAKRVNLTAFIVHNFEMENGSKELVTGRKPLEEGMRSSKKLVLDDHNYHQAMEVEVVLVEDLIMPLTFIMKYAIPFHDTIIYDYAEKQFVLVKGSLHRKVFCILWQFIILYRLGIKAIPGLSFGILSQSEDSGGISAVAKGAYSIFVGFSCLTFYIYWTQVKSICDIFNLIIGLSGKLHLRHKSPPRTKIVKCVAHFSWSFVLGYVLLTMILYLLSVFYPHLTEESHNMSMNSTNSTNGTGSFIRKKKGSDIDFTEIHATDDILIIQVINAITGFMNLFGWMMTFFHLGVWSVIFRQLIMLFYWRIEALRELGKFFVIPHEIRTFNNIGCIIDRFNQIYGFMLLFGTVVVVTYISPSLKNVAPGFQNILKMSSGAHLLLSYVPMTVVSFLTAEVQRVAGNFAGIIKEEYGKFSKECGDAAESLCGIAIVHYDLVTTNIGIKGSGFFTVTYQFITTIVSLIITYSILVIQLFPQDKSDIEV